MSALGKMNLRPFERRLLVGVLVVLFLVVNVVFVWPHFKDLNTMRDRNYSAHDKLGRWQKEISLKGDFEKKIQEYEEVGATVAAEDQANQFFRAVQNQASISGVSLPSIMRQSTRTNEFFIELLQTFRVQANEAQIVDFLYNLGEGESVIRARGVSLRPNGPRQMLEGSIDLIASYQKIPKKPAPKAAATNNTTTVK